MAEYKNPELLVTTDWVLENKDNPEIKVVESNEDILLYDLGHVEGAIKLDWETELQDRVVRDYVNKDNFEKLMSSKGISPEDTVVFYGDKSNWWACYALWTFKIYGHAKCLIMNGGRQKWVEEEKPLTKDVAELPATNYKVSNVNLDIRAFRDEVREHSDSKKALIDVRSPKEFTGEMLHMEAYPQEGALRGGHIPNAQ
ncbi:sulfurtransferase, partial [bacterium]|nr:sulfurtransferase [bacterium]